MGFINFRCHIAIVQLCEIRKAIQASSTNIMAKRAANQNELVLVLGAKWASSRSSDIKSNISVSLHFDIG